MKRAHQRPGLFEFAKITNGLIQSSTDTLLHLSGGFVGKSDGQYRSRGDTLCDQVCNPAGNDARFAGTGAGDDEQRPVDVLDRLGLFRRQIRQKMIDFNHVCRL